MLLFVLANKGGEHIACKIRVALRTHSGRDNSNFFFNLMSLQTLNVGEESISKKGNYMLIIKINSINK